MKKGFTLIELLIVVAIIAILAAIAIPNFLAAQTRSKISRTKADLRSVALALESYFTDNNEYPLYALPAGHYLFIDFNDDAYGPSPAKRLSTPISYISSIPIDQFTFSMSGNYRYPFRYGTFRPGVENPSGVSAAGYNDMNFKYHGAWMLGSAGPDKAFYSYYNVLGAQDVERTLYDPSNGTISNGDILRNQGGSTPNQ